MKKRKQTIKQKKEKVLIIGFGRIGRMLFAQLFLAEDYEIVGICGMSPPHMISKLIEYDMENGKYPRYNSLNFF